MKNKNKKVMGNNLEIVKIKIGGTVLVEMDRMRITHGKQNRKWIECNQFEK